MAYLSLSLLSLSQRVRMDSRSKTTLSRSEKAQSLRPLATSASIVASVKRKKRTFLKRIKEKSDIHSCSVLPTLVMFSKPNNCHFGQYPVIQLFAKSSN